MKSQISGSQLLNNSKAKSGQGTLGTDDFVGMGNPEEQKDDEGSIDEVDRLREENKRLKKTLLEKF